MAHRTIGDSYGTSGTKRVYREESPGNWDATQLKAEDANQFQEEIANIIEDAGLSLNSPGEPIASMNQASGVIQGYVAAEAFTRNANDRVANGDLVRNEVNDLSIETGDGNRPLAHLMRFFARDIQGCKVSNPIVPSDTVQVDDGIAIDATKSQIINFESAIAKDLETLWVAGAGNGGRANQTLNDGSWWHFFIIKKSDGTVDAGFDSALIPTQLLTDSGYTWYRRVASVYYVDSTTKVRPFVHDPNTGYFLHQPGFVTDTVLTLVQPQPTVTTFTLADCVPAGLSLPARLFINHWHTTAGSQLRLWDGVAGAGIAATSQRYTSFNYNPTEILSFLVDLVTDTSQRVYMTEYLAGTACNVGLYCAGYFDRRII